MPTITAAKSDRTEVKLLGGLVAQGASTGRGDPVTLELLLDYAHGNSPSIWFSKFSMHEGMDVSALGSTILRAELEDSEYHTVPPAGDVFSYARQAVSMPDDYDFLFLGTDTSEQQTTADISLLVRREVKEVATSISSKLRERLSRFKAGFPGQEPVSPETRASVNELVAWFCTKSDTVSATVASDGVLSVATVFPKDIRLYVEIDRDGNIEAAVTRERRYASDISGNTVADLTPEVILAAVKRISSI